MKNFAIKGLTSLLCCGLLSAAVANEPEAITLNTRLVHFPAFGGKTPLEVMGVFRTPQGAGKFPVVIILHGSAGIDSRGAMHAQNLAKAGIASLELDMWGARGLNGGAKGRPEKVHDTLPDLWGAEVWLANQEKIDAKRIGVMGFSWGVLWRCCRPPKRMDRQQGFRLYKEILRSTRFAGRITKCPAIASSR
ncbi:Predicted dienelactone hydrolase [Iodobacter fluviatilis]|uniref:Predicted dienelactone hydrolase n=1 Tax=Iodobacter fluviatilis TaxID=537 RepID=A0A377Q8M8_9NEIS|nr:Predicted dienelactone hydrolase [Iodobacter fluviatilis]